MPEITRSNAAENTALIQRFEDSFVAGDIDDVLKTLSPDIVVHEAANTPYPGDHVGHDGFLALAQAFGSTWQMTAPIDLDITSLGEDRVVVSVRLEVNGRRTGVPITLRITEIYRIADNQIVSIDVFYWDNVELMRAAGPEVVVVGSAGGDVAESAQEVVRKFESAVLDHGDFDLAMEYAQPDLTVREAPGMPYQECYVGRRGLDELMADVGAVWEFVDGPRIYFEQALYDRNCVYTRVEGRAVLQATGDEYDFLVTERVLVRDGKVADIEVFYFDQAPAVLAAASAEAR
ncbi:nuclear transport factor 2 family protein [Dietzia aurantiaca]|uniref:Nuclear transport factor 2 family protein n=1 Tax=Dietzia aurantiaca TaxID=983873 RepID=A0ABV9PRJ1_9ACTN